VVEVAPRDLHDPFAPARDVRQAVSENVEVLHDVQSGENFWSIAKQHYGSGKYFTALAAYNKARIPDPQKIRPGMKVQVPSEAVLAQQYPQLVSGTKTTPYTAAPAGPPGFSLDPHGRPQYRVSKGDTLSDIAQRHLGRASRWRQIFGMNMDQLPSAESLTTGMVLRLPPDASQIPMSAAELRSR
jgi:nucleoid-associated protein YgaU